MPKSRKSLSSYVKKRRRNPGLLKWLQENKHTRSHLQASNSSCNTGVNKSLEMEMETEPKSNTVCSETETPMTQNEIFHILLDHPYNKPPDVQSEPRCRLHAFESEITCSSTPQPDSTAQHKTRRRLNMDVDKDNSTPQLTEDNFSNNLSEGNVSDGLPVSRDVVGRRIVNLAFFFEQIKQIDNHNRDFGCTISNCYVVSEKNNGLKFTITLKCNMCREKLFLHSEDPHLETMDVNTGSVAGAMAVGIGHYQMQELFAAMEIPYMSFKTYNKTHDKVAYSWEETALDEMRAAVTEEVKFARDNGHVSPDGTPVLTVVADGSWAKRSYRTNYNSLAGVAAIVGYHTKKVIFLGVRNKYCTICARAASTSTEARQHTCFKNWTGSSSSMEPDIILEGFMSSMAMYGVMYGRILADGDSSVYASIIEARPYPNLTVEKVECTNHLMRNYCNKVKDIALNTRSGPIHLRKVIGRNVMNLRRAVTGAVEYRRSQTNTDSKKLEALAKDIINGPSHVFGEHSKCETYFCKGPKQDEKNHILELKESGLYQQVMKHVNYLADNARSLMLKMNNNPVEHYNSIIAKYIGGKRVNFAVKRSYKARCLAAAVSFNTGQPLYRLHKKMFNRSPGKVLKTLQTARSRKITNKHKKIQEKPRKPKSTNINRKERQENAKHYGEAAMKPDMPIDVFRRKAKDFLKSLKKTEEERKEIERATILQASSGRWMEERRKLVTASKYASICKRRKTTSCQKLVRTLLYSKDFNTSSTAYGRQNEAVALRVFEETTGLKVDKCGLFIDEEIPYLGATPDGLIGEDGLIEVKCPATCKNMTPEDGVMSGKFTFWHIDKQSNSIGPVNKSSDYFYQIQGQLHVTKRQFCYLVMWTPLGIRYEKILRDNTFWEGEMKEKLKKFYHDCLLPELVDPRHTRSMPIRDPPYIVDAMKKSKEQKCKKNPKESKAN